MTDKNQLTPSQGRKVTHADLTRVNLPKAFWRSRTDRIQDVDARGVVSRYRENVLEMVSTGSGLLFHGLPGRGKTSAAACVLKEAISRGRETYFVTHIELKDLRSESMRSTKEALFGSGSDGVTIRKKVEIAQFLVLDGFGESFFTDNMFGPSQLEELLTRRLANRLATVMTIRSVETLRSGKWADLFELITQGMVPVQVAGDNMRDAERDKLSRRVLGGGER